MAMKDTLHAKDSGFIQIPYDEYTTLMENMRDVERCQGAKENALELLQAFLGGQSVHVSERAQQPEPSTPDEEAAPVNQETPPVDQADTPKQEEEPPASDNAPVEAAPVQEEEVAEPVAEEMESAEPAPAEPDEPPVQEEEAPEPEKVPETQEAAPEEQAADETDEQSNETEGTDQPSEDDHKSDVDIPTIKENISAHFNQIDESGRMFGVLQQYYTFLNENCGGTIRITMKDGLCSFWNYDEWAEFAFVDVSVDGQRLRVSLDERYLDELKSLSICDVPRLLAGRLNLVSVEVDDLNNTLLDILARAFKEVGLSTQ